MNLRPRNLATDLVLPTLLFVALGAMNWAVRGTRGFGGGTGCIFAGVMWGTAWWFCAREPRREPSRRYASGWIVAAITFGMAIAGERGWRQWSHFFVGQLATNWDKQELVPIDRGYGFLWLFIAGVPWAGLSACFLAWCGSLRETRAWHWLLRIACGIGAGLVARALFDHFPQYFLPLYTSIEERYRDLDANPDLRRIINDCGDAVTHLGYYLGFLLFEVVRREWKNVVLILTVGILNGVGWAALQNWEWAPAVWPKGHFLWWRCWESTGGMSIGLALGVAYFLVNRRMAETERAMVAARRSIAGPNFEWLIFFSCLTAMLAVFVDYLFGPGGSVGVSTWGLAASVEPFVQAHFDSWGRVYFATVILFGAAYYFSFRGTAVDEQPSRRGPLAVLAGAEIGAVCLVAALVAGLLAENEIRQGIAAGVRLVAPDAADGLASSDAKFWLRLVYVAVVALAGLGWYFARREKFDAERSRGTPNDGDPNLERLGVPLGVFAGLAVSLLNGIVGWFKTYRGESVELELWHWLGPVYFLILLAILAWTLRRPLPRSYSGDLHPQAYRLLWLVLIVQNLIAQLVTGPHSQWNQAVFSIYYVLLFLITALTMCHVQVIRDTSGSR